MQSKLHIDLSQGLVEIEGDADLVREIYRDLKDHLLSGARPSGPSQPRAPAAAPAASEGDGETKSKAKPRKGKAGPSARDQVEAVRNLDLRPSGKVSFSDFIAEKLPPSNQDKYAVAIYWMEQVADISPVTVAHVAAIFKQTPGWREPNNLRVGLTTTAARKNTIDTADLNALKTTPHGRNFVEHDLPAKS